MASASPTGKEYWLDSSIFAEWIAAAATSMTAVLIVITRRADTKPVVFTPAARKSVWQAKLWAGDDAPNASINFSNASTSQALQVQAIGVGCQARVTQHGDTCVYPASLVPCVGSGETIGVYVRCEADAWCTAQVVIVWRESSTWRKKLREQIGVFNLANMVEQPEYAERDGVGRIMPSPPVRIEPDLRAGLLEKKSHRNRVRLVCQRLRMLQRLT